MINHCLVALEIVTFVQIVTFLVYSVSLDNSDKGDEKVCIFDKVCCDMDAGLKIDMAKGD